MANGRVTSNTKFTDVYVPAGAADNGTSIGAAFHVWNQYAIRVTDGRRDALRSYLAERGVGTEIYYPVPMHRQECFADLEVDPQSLVETDRASEEVLNLPIFPGLTEAEQNRVVDSITNFFSSQAQAAA